MCLVQPPAQSSFSSGVREDCSEFWPVWPCKSLRMEAAQYFWATCSTLLLWFWWKSVSLMSEPQLRVSVPCPPTTISEEFVFPMISLPALAGCPWLPPKPFLLQAEQAQPCSLSALHKCSGSYPVVVVLHWFCCSLSMSLLHWKAQNGTGYIVDVVSWMLNGEKFPLLLPGIFMEYC